MKPVEFKVWALLFTSLILLLFYSLSTAVYCETDLIVFQHFFLYPIQRLLSLVSLLLLCCLLGIVGQCRSEKFHIGLCMSTHVLIPKFLDEFGLKS
jgi:hypothetical protein